MNGWKNGTEQQKQFQQVLEAENLKQIFWAFFSWDSHTVWDLQDVISDGLDRMTLDGEPLGAEDAHNSELIAAAAVAVVDAPFYSENLTRGLVILKMFFEKKRKK